MSLDTQNSQINQLKTKLNAEELRLNTINQQQQDSNRAVTRNLFGSPMPPPNNQTANRPSTASSKSFHNQGGQSAYINEEILYLNTNTSNTNQQQNQSNPHRQIRPSTSTTASSTGNRNPLTSGTNYWSCVAPIHGLYIG